MTRIYLLLVATSFFIACNSSTENQAEGHETHSSDQENTEHNHSYGSNSDIPQTVHYEKESNLNNVKQLTFGGDNAEAYFSYDNQHLIFQATNPKWNAECDQIFYMPIGGFEGDQPPLLSTGKGRTTCSYFMPDGKSIVYASTHLGVKPVLKFRELSMVNMFGPYLVILIFFKLISREI